MTTQDLINRVRADLNRYEIGPRLVSDTDIVNSLNDALQEVCEDGIVIEREHHGLTSPDSPMIVLPSDMMIPSSLELSGDTTKLYLVEFGKINHASIWTTAVTDFTITDLYAVINANMFLEDGDTLHVPFQANVESTARIDGEILIVDGAPSGASVTVERNNGSGTAADNISVADDTALYWNKINVRTKVPATLTDYQILRGAAWSIGGTAYWYALHDQYAYIYPTPTEAIAYVLRYVPAVLSGASYLPPLSMSSLTSSPLIPAAFHKVLWYKTSANLLYRSDREKGGNALLGLYQDALDRTLTQWGKKETGNILMNPEWDFAVQ